MKKFYSFVLCFRTTGPFIYLFCSTATLYVGYRFSPSVSFITIKSLISSHVLLSIISCQQGSHSYHSFSSPLCPITDSRTSLLAKRHMEMSLRDTENIACIDHCIAYFLGYYINMYNIIGERACLICSGGVFWKSFLK